MLHARVSGRLTPPFAASSVTIQRHSRIAREGFASLLIPLISNLLPIPATGTQCLPCGRHRLAAVAGCRRTSSCGVPASLGRWASQISLNCTHESNEPGISGCPPRPEQAEPLHRGDRQAYRPLPPPRESASGVVVPTLRERMEGGVRRSADEAGLLRGANFRGAEVSARSRLLRATVLRRLSFDPSILRAPCETDCSSVSVLPSGLQRRNAARSASPEHCSFNQ